MWRNHYWCILNSCYQSKSGHPCARVSESGPIKFKRETLSAHTNNSGTGLMSNFYHLLLPILWLDLTIHTVSRWEMSCAVYSWTFISATLVTLAVLKTPHNLHSTCHHETESCIRLIGDILTEKLGILIWQECITSPLPTAAVYLMIIHGRINNR